MKKNIILIALMMLPPFASAEEVEIGGLWYSLDATSKEAMVIESQRDSYSGDIVVPPTIIYGGVEYYVTSIGDEAFLQCTDLTSIAFPDKLTWIEEGAFCGCSALTSITIPNSVLAIGMEAFANCRGLTSATLPNNLKTLSQSVFLGCSSLASITIPNSVTVIESMAFHGCTSLTSIIIPDNVTSIQSLAFRYCSNLVSITFSNSLTTIGEQAFYGCSGLTSVTIPDGVTTIERYSFYGCSDLKTLTIGSAVNEISRGAFSGLQELMDVYCYAETRPHTDSDTFSGSHPENVTLHVPAVSLEAYKAVTPWSSFKAVVAIGEETKKCATPTITCCNGKVRFACETEGVEYVPTVSFSQQQPINGDELELGGTFIVSVYAVKDGYDNSDTATMTINMSQMGDVNADGELNAADITAVVNAILGKQ